MTKGTVSSGDVLEKRPHSQDIVSKKSGRLQQCVLCLKSYHRRCSSGVSKLVNAEECDECISIRVTPSVNNDASTTNRSRRECRRQADGIKETPLAKGDRVEVNWKKKGSYFPAVISKVHPNGSCNVVYDDKSREQHVDSELISIANDNKEVVSSPSALEAKKDVVVKPGPGKMVKKPRSLEPKKARRLWQQLSVSEEKGIHPLPPVPQRTRVRSQHLRSLQKEVSATSKVDIVDQQINGEEKHARRRPSSFGVSQRKPLNSHQHIASLPAKTKAKVKVSQRQQQQRLNSQGRDSFSIRSLDVNQHPIEKKEGLGHSDLEKVIKKKRKYSGVTLSYGTWIARESWGIYSDRKIIGRYDTQRKAAKAYDAHRVKCGKGQAVNVPEEFDPNADQLRLVDAEETISEEEPKDTRQLRYMKEWMTRNFDSNGKFWPEIIVPPPPVGTHDASLVRSDGKTTHNLCLTQQKKVRFLLYCGECGRHSANSVRNHPRRFPRQTM